MKFILIIQESKVGFNWFDLKYQTCFLRAGFDLLLAVIFYEIMC